MKVPFSYLDRQFSEIDAFLGDLKEFVMTGDFTLGGPLEEFEKQFSGFCGAPYGIGVASGTDALILAMKMLGIGAGDEVITTPMTFIATVGAIVATGATPVFVDSEDGFMIDPNKIEQVITPKTKAILPVHYSGNMADMPRIRQIADAHNLFVVEDACQAIGGEIKGQQVGHWSDAAAFSFHPLKNLNVWSDGGMIITHSKELNDKLRLYRNHGLVGRDEVASFGINSRLDTVQAVIALRLMPDLEARIQRRIAIAQRYDEAFAQLSPAVRVPHRREGVQHAFHLYMVRVENRDEVLTQLQSVGIEAKVHYPIPLHLQPAAKSLGYQRGDFPVCEQDCDQIITLPAHPYLTDAEVEYVIERVEHACLQKV